MELHVLDVATGSMTRVYEGNPRASLEVIGFSPQGDRILFSEAETRQDGESLWSIGVDGSDARPLVVGTNQGEWLAR